MTNRIKCPISSNEFDSPIQGGGTVTGGTILCSCPKCGNRFDPRDHPV